MVYTDKNGVLFTLKPGTKIYEEAVIQHYNDEEHDLARKHGEVFQLTFAGMTIEEIEKEYGEMNKLRDY
jgi:hypothetical protein